ncbi:DNA-directed DNA polymerase [Tanacetum coccineum]
MKAAVIPVLTKMDAMTMKMDAQYKEIQSCAKCNHCGGMPNYGKFLKELVNNKHKIEQISSAFLSDESSAIIQNKVPPKLKDPRSFPDPLKSLNEPPTDLELKSLLYHLEYAFLEEPSFLPVIISSQLSEQNKNKLVSVLKRHKQAFAWKTTDILESVEVFMDDFSVFGNYFDNCLNNLDKMLQRCKDANLVLNWEKRHFMVKEGIVLGHKVSGARLEVEKAKIDLMCDASEFAVGAVFGQKDGKHFHPIYFASKTLNAAQQNYIVTRKELMAVVFAFDEFQPYLVLSKTAVYTDLSALRHLFKKQDGTENVAADHLSQIENDETSDDKELNDNFPGETDDIK